MRQGYTISLTYLALGYKIANLGALMTCWDISYHAENKQSSKE